MWLDLIRRAASALVEPPKKKKRRKRTLSDEELLLLLLAKYAGGSAAPPPSPPAPDPREIRASRIDAALTFLERWSGIPRAEIVRDPATRDRAYKTAARKLHPDMGGSEEMFKLLAGHHQLLRETLA